MSSQFIHRRRLSLHVTLKDMEPNATAEYTYPEFLLPKPARFWLILVFEVPSLFCSLLLLAFLFTDRASRKSLQNHVIIALLVVGLFAQLIDVPFYLNFTRVNSITPPSSVTCVLWWFAATCISNLTNLLMAWASIERHILVFHDRWVASYRRRILFHYLPLILILVYATIYYVWLIFFPPCQHNYAYEFVVCSATPCHLVDPVLSVWEMGVHGCLPTLIIACFSIGLLIRVILKKRFHDQGFQWRKYRKMIIQLLSLSVVYLAFNLPIMVIWMARSLGASAEALAPAQLVTFFLTYWVMLLLPIVSLTSLSDLKKKVRQIICPTRRNQVTATFSIGNMVRTSCSSTTK